VIDSSDATSSRQKCPRVDSLQAAKFQNFLIQNEKLVQNRLGGVRILPWQFSVHHCYASLHCLGNWAKELLKYFQSICTAPASSGRLTMTKEAGVEFFRKTCSNILGKQFSFDHLYLKHVRLILGQMADFYPELHPSLIVLADITFELLAVMWKPSSEVSSLSKLAAIVFTFQFEVLVKSLPLPTTLT